MPEVMVKVTNVRKKFSDDAGEFDVLKNVSFSIKRGEMVSLVGISGAGKTTLLQILGGLDRATEGTVCVGGKVLGELSGKELALFRNRQIGFVFQFHHLLPDFTAAENLFIPGLISGNGKKECMKRADELLDAFGLGHRKGHYPAELSGGERQRVALARAMFNKPALVLADEPTGNLDRANGELLLELFEKANKEFEQTFLIATHNNRLSQGLDRVLYLDDGNIKGTDKAITATDEW
ncbi:ABC transporter ATP-binding protein [Chitinispirillales bacterium ANBcel5]|uniref:ABC transporter ATP-binding protein n=1 Tax=Cellulosispirillum alkaliphilum TaxID=3039283 RepID=UPI002A571C4F|nr:ABC transporter ATP-binding protein [Chitinispirillales bacterium ANBcel5]